MLMFVLDLPFCKRKMASMEKRSILIEPDYMLPKRNEKDYEEELFLWKARWQYTVNKEGEGD